MTSRVEPTTAGPSLGPVVVAWALAAICVAAAVTGLLLDSADDGLVRWKWLVLAVAISVPGALIAAARPRALLGWLLVAVALCFSLTGLAQAWVRYAGAADQELAAVAVWYADRFGAVVLPVAVVALTLLPDSRLPGPRWRAPVAVAVLVQVGLVVAWSFSATPAAATESAWPDDVAALDNPVGVLPRAFADAVSDLAWVLTLPLLLPVAAMVVRLRRSHGADRSRLVVLLLALGVLVGAILGGNALGAPLDVVAELLASLFFGLVLVSAVLRRQLEGVSFVVHHAFVFTTLGAVVVGVYVLAVGTLAAIGPDLSRFGAGVVAAVAALLVQPLRVRLQRWVDRLMRGDRRDPFQAVTRLAERTHRAPSLEGVLGAVASSLATSLRVPRVQVEAFGVREEQPLSVGVRGDVGPEHRSPLMAGDREIGSVVLTLQPGRRLRADEQRLLTELGRHAGLAVDSVRLAAEVAEHHREVVSAREEERRRLGRELHDELGPTVAGLSMQLGALRPLVRRDPDAVVARLARLEQSASAALADIRRVAHELRPPVLDQLGLAPSVRQMAKSLDLEVVEEAVAHGPLPAVVELAAYRIAAEALTNVARHSGTRSVRLELRETGGCLVLVVADHGRGVEAGHGGLGRETMRERAEELGGTFSVRSGPGGGTVVTAALPLSTSVTGLVSEAGR
jgi:two-component system NarL family sensor kinase